MSKHKTITLPEVQDMFESCQEGSVVFLLRYIDPEKLSATRMDHPDLTLINDPLSLRWWYAITSSSPRTRRRC
jgi:hypothetical protein